MDVLWCIVRDFKFPVEWKCFLKLGYCTSIKFECAYLWMFDLVSLFEDPKRAVDLPVFFFLPWKTNWLHCVHCKAVQCSIATAKLQCMGSNSLKRDPLESQWSPGPKWWWWKPAVDLQTLWRVFAWWSLAMPSHPRCSPTPHLLNGSSYTVGNPSYTIRMIHILPRLPYCFLHTQGSQGDKPWYGWLSS